MKKVLLAVLAAGVLTACTNNKQTTDKDMTQTFLDKLSAASVERQLTQEWDKVFPLSEKVNHKKVTFETQYGLTLAADLYTPKAAIEREKSELASTSEREQARPKVKAEGYNFIGKPNPVPENKQLLIIPGASHCDLYDGGYTELVGKGEAKNMIPWDKLEDFFKTNLK